ncbi:MAG TPA: tRNA (guanosine(37)-N1)-methyltransferase TrmD [Candidatus Eisenbergiella pullicola]|nr:tRNA (guanosine(37)-N1)-methyltransferase TrmD [Candidatus Eisenbergiella pullicola]
MRFHILTLFPEMVLGCLNTSILGRAADRGILEVNAVNIRDYTLDKHKKVDDYPYGGGAGMLMQAQPIFDAWQAVRKKSGSGRSMRVIYVTPQGKVFDQQMAREFAKEEELCFLCGHYEGVDERVLEEIVTDFISIGDYVLTGGELPAAVMIDAIARMVPGVLKNEESGEVESFRENLLEYPQYTRPEVWMGRPVPRVLLSGDHAKVDAWRRERSVERTKERRPDLYERYDLSGRAMEYLKRDKVLHMDMIEDIRNGQARVIAVRKDGVILQDTVSKVYMVTAENPDAGERLLSLADPNAEVFTCHQKFLAESIARRFSKKDCSECFQVAYTKKVPLSEPEGVSVRVIGEEYTDLVHSLYPLIEKRERVREILRDGIVYGAFLQKESGARELVGFIGTHEEGAMGMLHVLEPYRRLGIAEKLESFLINRLLEQGRTPYAQIFTDNAASLKLQEKLGLRIAGRKIYWIS